MSPRATRMTEAEKVRLIESLRARLRKIDLDTAEHFLLIALAEIFQRRNSKGGVQ